MEYFSIVYTACQMHLTVYWLLYINWFIPIYPWEFSVKEMYLTSSLPDEFHPAALTSKYCFNTFKK
jgi:hypothetical protein